jgi:archaeal chaperonin
MPEEVLSNESERTLGRDAQRNNILAARVISETVKTTLGPKGMDKMLVDRAGGVTITNDGATILEEMEIEHPAAKMIVEVSKTQEEEVGDGTTTAVMLAGKLLENAEDLLDKKIHPTLITKGYRWAATKSLEYLESLSYELDSEEDLRRITHTAMTGKGVEYVKEALGEIIVDAVKMVANGKIFNRDDIRIQKKKGSNVEKSSLIEGIVLDNGRANQGMPRIIENAKIALIEESLAVSSPEAEARISVSSPEQLQQFISQEERELQSKVSKLKEAGASVVICQKGIDEVVQFYLAKEGIYGVRRIPKSDMTAISKATGARIVSKLSELEPSHLGAAGKVEEKKENEDEMTYITQCEKPEIVTIIIRGSTDHVMDEVERAVDDALGDLSSALQDSRIVVGGGAIEIELNKKLLEFANTLPGRERLAVEEFAKALEFIPVTLAENAGLDPIDILAELKAAHDAGNQKHGLNLFSGKIEDNLAAGIIEPKSVKRQAISSATDVAIMILRIDDVIASKTKSSKAKGANGPISGYD